MTIPIFERVAVLREKAEAVISCTRKYPFFSLATLLHGLSWVFKGLVLTKNFLYRIGVLRSHELPCAVISIGNVTVGGTGKTPLSIYLARLVTELGYRVVVLSRGYRGQSEKLGAIVSDGQTILCNARQSGDEPFLMASLLKTVPVIVGSDRVKIGKMAVARFQPDVILLDDAFQHRRLKRDLDIVLLDDRAPFGNSFMLPRGPLRESVHALKRAHAIVLTRCAEPTSEGFRRVAGLAAPRPVFCAFHRSLLRGILPSGHLPKHRNLIMNNGSAAEAISGSSVYAFSGLARNETFWETISELAGNLSGHMGFADHHHYSHTDLQRIVAASNTLNCSFLVTTDKDFVRLPDTFRFPMPLVVLGIRIDFKNDSEGLSQYMAQCLGRISPNKRSGRQPTSKGR